MMAAWTPCPCCENYWCNLHAMHAFECPCPPVGEWDVDPYSAGADGDDEVTTNAKEMRPMTTSERTREFWLGLAQRYVTSPAMAEKVADYCVANPGTCLWHAAWDLHGRRGPCDCAVCRKSRGEKPVCL
jgi:hypothetical protein